MIRVPFGFWISIETICIESIRSIHHFRLWFIIFIVVIMIYADVIRKIIKKKSHRQLKHSIFQLQSHARLSSVDERCADGHVNYIECSSKPISCQPISFRSHWMEFRGDAPQHRHSSQTTLRNDNFMVTKKCYRNLLLWSRLFDLIIKSACVRLRNGHGNARRRKKKWFFHNLRAQPI